MGGQTSEAALPAGSRRNQLNQPKNPSYQPVRNTEVTVDGVDYTKHAVDRMQDRGIPPTVVKNTITNGVQVSTRDGVTKYYDSVNNVSALVNNEKKLLLFNMENKIDIDFLQNFANRAKLSYRYFSDFVNYTEFRFDIFTSDGDSLWFEMEGVNALLLSEWDEIGETVTLEQLFHDKYLDEVCEVVDNFMAELKKLHEHELLIQENKNKKIKKNLIFILNELRAQPELAILFFQKNKDYDKEIEVIRKCIIDIVEYELAFDFIKMLIEDYPFKLSDQALKNLQECELLLKEDEKQ